MEEIAMMKGIKYFFEELDKRDDPPAVIVQIILAISCIAGFLVLLGIGAAFFPSM